MKLTDEQKDLLIGTLLGDGNLHSITKGRTWYYSATHFSKQELYLFHKFEILKTFSSAKPHLHYKIMRSQKHAQFTFTTLVDDVFRFFGNLFYTYDPVKDCFIKDVPVNIEKFLTPRAVAYWYMDDGTLKWKGRSNGMVICTDSFSEHGVQRLKNAFKNLFNIEIQLIRKSNLGIFSGYRLSINEANSKAFRELIEPYLLPSMRYKVSDGNKGHL